METIFTYHDYEEAYYSVRYHDCKIIGLQLLSKLTDKRSKELYKKLEKFEFDWLNPDYKNSKLLLEIRV